MGELAPAPSAPTRRPTPANTCLVPPTVYHREPISTTTGWPRRSSRATPATDAADAALVGELRRGRTTRKRSGHRLGGEERAITLVARAQAYDRFVLFRGSINDLIDFEGAAALASKRRASGGEASRSRRRPHETVRAAFRISIPQTKASPLRDALAAGRASLKRRRAGKSALRSWKSVDGVAACLVLVNGLLPRDVDNESTILERSAARRRRRHRREKQGAGRELGRRRGLVAPSFDQPAPNRGSVCW